MFQEKLYIKTKLEYFSYAISNFHRLFFFSYSIDFKLSPKYADRKLFS